MTDKLRYSIYIRWSDEDQCYIAWLPEFGEGCKTHGASYEEAAKHGHEVLQMLIDGNKNLPKPFVYGSGHTVTPPSYESEPLDQDWYEKALVSTERACVERDAVAKQAAG